jgi:hypothetical protein
MAEDKKGFILYADMRGTFDKLPNDRAGELIKHIFSYVNDENPTPSDLVIEIAFEQIKSQLKRDLKKWKLTKELKSNAGKLGNLKRWNKDLYDKVLKKELSINEAEIIATDRKESHSDVLPSHPIAKIAVNVNDNVNVNEKEIDIIKDFISKKFGFNEVNHFPNYKIITYCVTYHAEQDEKTFSHFKDQIKNYFKYKEKKEENKHSFVKFIGTPEMNYSDGGWNAENWGKKYSEVTGENKQKESPLEKAARITEERLERNEQRRNN